MNYNIEKARTTRGNYKATSSSAQQITTCTLLVALQAILMLKKIEKRFFLLMLIVLFSTLLSGLFLPVYSDEIVTKFYMARFFLEDAQIVSLFPQCTTSVGHALAWIFYPAAILFSSVYEYLEPLGIRLSGLVLALAWFAILGYWCFRQSVNERMERFTLLAGLGSLGVMPYLWILSRAEQFMSISVLIFCITALYQPHQRNKVWQLTYAGALSVLISVFFFSHPKSIFFAPFILVAVWISTRGFNIMIRLGLGLYVVALCVQAFLDINRLGGCADAPAVQALLSANSLTPKMLLSEPLAFIKAVCNNFIKFPYRMLIHLGFNSTFQSGWLPPIENSVSLARWLNPLIYFTLFTLVIGSHALAIVLGSIKLLRHQITAPLMLAALLATGDLVNIALYNLQNFYSASQYIPFSIIIVALLLQSLPNIQLTPRPRKLLHLTLRFVVGLSFASLLALLSLVTPNLIQNSNYSNASLPGQSLSIPVFGVDMHLKSILELGKQCNIPQEQANYLVLDHMTYFAYLKNKNPVHILYISELGYGGDLTNGRLLPFLKARNSPGLITRCEWVPNEFRSIQRQNDRGYCCVDFNQN